MLLKVLNLEGTGFKLGCLISLHLLLHLHCLGLPTTKVLAAKSIFHICQTHKVVLSPVSWSIPSALLDEHQAPVESWSPVCPTSQCLRNPQVPLTWLSINLPLFFFYISHRTWSLPSDIFLFCGSSRIFLMASFPKMFLLWHLLGWLIKINKPWVTAVWAQLSLDLQILLETRLQKCTFFCIAFSPLNLLVLHPKHWGLNRLYLWS